MPRKEAPQAHPTLQDRYTKYVDDSGGPDADWPWTGAAKRGRGVIRVGGRDGYTQTAEGVGFALANGIPVDEVGPVRQTCGNLLCQNPTHLTDMPAGIHPDGTPMSLEDRIATQVQPTEGGHELWQGSLDKNGYPTIWVGWDARPRQPTVARARWESNYGPIADGFYVVVTCRNRLCVALAHLKAEPRWLIVSRGRTRLNDSDVRAIRAAYARGDVTQQQLADRYGIRQRAISDIVTGFTFRHVA